MKQRWGKELPHLHVHCQEPPRFPNHIIVGHYWGSFSCGKCLAFVAVTAQQMKRHIAGCGKPQMEHSKAWSTCSRVLEAHSGSRPSHRSRKAKKRTDKEGVGTAAWSRPCSSPTKSIPAVTFQEQAPNTPDRRMREVTSISGHLWTSKEH